jgi:hypothetical protein
LDNLFEQPINTHQILGDLTRGMSIPVIIDEYWRETCHRPSSALKTLQSLIELPLTTRIVAPIRISD